MSRPIKFRAWAVSKNDGTKEMFDWETQRHAISEWIGNQERGVVLMQFTGLHDKNGREIFEGDILEWSDRETNGEIISQIDEVRLSNGAFVTYSKKYDAEDCFHDDGNQKQITTASVVIGNIYENPELLK